MKTALDPRHKKRQKIVEDLFKVEFHKQHIGPESIEIMAHSNALDKTISKAAPEFPIDKINKIDLAILRLAAFELLIAKKEPPRVIIDEAIELAKEYGDKASFAKINVDESPLLASQYGVMSIPTIMIFKSGKPAEQVIGYKPKNELKKMLDAVFKQ